MQQTMIWQDFGATGALVDLRSLAAYLGDGASQEVLKNLGKTFPKESDFRRDPAFDPDPHGLQQPEDLLDTTLLIHSLAAWGSVALLRAAFECARVQLASQGSCMARLKPLRDAAFEAASACVHEPSPAARDHAARAAQACSSRYEPFEDDPDSRAAHDVWRHLGAPWFAAETAVQDWTPYANEGVPTQAATWCRRNSVWPVRAADSAAEWSSHSQVQQAVRKSLIDWATRA